MDDRFSNLYVPGNSMVMIISLKTIEDIQKNVDFSFHEPENN